MEKAIKKTVKSKLSEVEAVVKKCVPSIPDALEFRRDQYGWTKKEMASHLGIQYSHYTEVLSGKRRLPLKGRIKAFKMGVPPIVLLNSV